MNKLIAVTLIFFAQSDFQKLDKEKFSVEYPRTWTMNSSGQYGTAFFVSSPRESEEDLFTENVNLIIQNLAGMNMDLDGFVSLSENQITTMIPKSNILESTRVEDEDQEFHRMIYTGFIQNFDVKLIQEYRIINNEAFVMTFTAEESQFDAYREVGEKILKSLRIK